ncbi:MAG: rhomboid family intramembrane serine protease [Gammaproteobacteria bacterium]
MFFLPLFDDNPTKSFPLITRTIILINVLIYFSQLTLSELQLNNFYASFGFIPFDFFNSNNFFYLPVFTSLFVHGGFIHLASNMLYLWIFGDNIEDRLGRSKFILFYFFGGFAASYFQALFEPNSLIPLIGASGSIAAVLGAYLLIFPKANIKVLFWFFIFLQIINVPAFLVLGVWIVGQFFSLESMVESNIAYVAHIGGFFTGIFLFLIFKNKQTKIFSESKSKPFEKSNLRDMYTSSIYDRKRSSGIKKYD